MKQQNIGEYIARKRKEKNLTQVQFSELLNVSNKTISKWETGKCMPDYSIIEDVCKILDISIAELMDGEDMPERSIRMYDEDHIKTLLDKTEKIERFKQLGLETLFVLAAVLIEIRGDMLMTKGIQYAFVAKIYYIFAAVVLLAIVYVRIRQYINDKK